MGQGRAQEPPVQVEQNALIVRGERFFEEKEGDEVLARERTEGVFSHQIFLGQHLVHRENPGEL
ncbi:MAG TPA: Hsp20/alpha crystallin family protein [Actinomycetota bacterium]|nr:Hsp20/alpha crystallin family protein [Actinomycetota bacterium]